MNIDDIRKRVELIADKAWDDEMAHAEEDSLYRDLVSEIADHGPEPWASMASEALKTKDINFVRWCV